MRRPAFLATSVLLPACIFAGFVIVPTCSARVVTVKFTATITKVNVSPPGGELTDDARLLAQSFKIGDLVEGVYAYDASAPDLSAYDWSGGYQFDARPCGIALSTNGFILKTDPEAVSVTVGTTNDLKPIIQGIPREEFAMASKNNLMTPQIGDFRCHAISLDLGALWPNDPLNDDSLPILAPALENWDIRRLTFGVYHGQQLPRVGWGSFESVEVEAVLTRAELLPDPAWVLYVDVGATPGGDGRSWPTAYTSLQDALASAPTVGNTELRVAQGTYRPDQGAGIESGDHDATFRLLNGVTIRGGYAGLGQPDPNAWDPAPYETVLSGDLKGNDDSLHDWTRDDNSSCIVTASGTNAAAVLEGVTIAHGVCFRSAPGGAAIYNMSGSPSIIRCLFTDNLFGSSGSVVLNHKGAAPRLQECIFHENRGGPGAVLCNQESAAMLRDCRFIDVNGVAVSEIASSSQLEGCSFTNNWRYRINRGPALLLERGSLTTLSGCAFAGNHGAVDDFGMWGFGSGLGSGVSCTDCVFTDNRHVDDGGAVQITNGSFTRCIFRDNRTHGMGGAIRARKVTLRECELIHNSAFEAGAVACDEAGIQGCLFAGNDAYWNGALKSPTLYGFLSIVPSENHVLLAYCTIVGNRSMERSTVEVAIAEATLMNCIVRDNVCRNTSLTEIGSGVTVGFTCVKDLPGATAGVGCIDLDPLFARPGYWDPNGTPEDSGDDFWVDGDYHLKSQAGRWDPASQSWVLDEVTSPCIDAGDPNSPIGEEPEPNGGRVNMGVYGGTSEASKSPASGPTAGLWSEPVPLAEVNLDAAEEWSPVLSADGLTLYFGRVNRPESYWGRIFQATRSSREPYSRFTSVTELPGSLNQSVEHVICPWISADGRRMYYTHQVGSVFRLMVSERPAGATGWPIGTEISELNQLDPRLHTARLTADELTIFFAGPDQQAGGAEYDIWMATRPRRDAPFIEPAPMTELNSPANDLQATPSTDGLSLYFASNRSGRYQLFRATREGRRASFGPPVHLAFFDTPGGHTMFPYLSPDGKEFYFMRQRGENRSARDIWVSYRLD